MSSQYPIEVFWSEEDEVWVADVLDLPGCAAHGDTPQEAVGEAAIAAEAWVEAAVATGRVIPEPSHRVARA